MSRFVSCLLAVAVVLTAGLAGPAPARAPAPPSGEGPYTQVFFQPGSAELDPRAIQELGRWAAAAGDQPAGRILVSGFTDTTGSTDANRALSQRRARAVAGALVDLGVDPDRIDVEGLGEDDVAVATADGVAEPLNRRAAVSFASGGCMSQGGAPVCAPQRGVPFCPGDRRCRRPRG